MKHKSGKCSSQGKYHYKTLVLLSALLLNMVSPSVTADDNVHFRGALVAEPCVIPPGDEEIQLDFGTIIDKYLYLNMRTQGQAFDIRLADCDLTLGNSVTVTFQGTENTALPGLLAIDGNSVATGIAIGLETRHATPIPLNEASSRYLLQEGSNVISLKAYVQGEPQAIADRMITHGPFSAVVTFSLVYE